MTIKIERKTGPLGDYFEAIVPDESTQALSTNGHEWAYPNGRKPGPERIYKLRSAFHAALAATPERAKVGEYVCIHWAVGKCLVTDSNQLGITVELDNDATCTVSHYDYTVVSEPAPKTYTGNPIKEKWGPGFFEEVDGVSRVMVDVSDWAWVSRCGSVIGSEQGQGDTLAGLTFTRISTNPSDGINWNAAEGGE